MSSPRFTVFTATFNRAESLLRLFNELSNQTYADFEWVIVNDGSTDNTLQVLETISKSASFPVICLSKPNGGKHTAWRLASKYFQGKYVVTADDDDPIALDMLEIFDRYWSELESSDSYSDFWEVRARCSDPNGKLIGPDFSTPFFDSDYNEVTYKLKINCEMVGCRKRNVLLNEARVPEEFIFDSYCSNFAEGIRWSRAARKFKTRFVRDITRIYTPADNGLCDNVFTRCVDNGDKKLIYNKIIEFYYTLRERRDLLLKFNPKRYLINLLGLSLLSRLEHIDLKIYKLPKTEKGVLYISSIFIGLYIKVRQRCKAKLIQR